MIFVYKYCCDCISYAVYEWTAPICGVACAHFFVQSLIVTSVLTDEHASCSHIPEKNWRNSAFEIFTSHICF